MFQPLNCKADCTEFPGPLLSTLRCVDGEVALCIFLVSLEIMQMQFRSRNLFLK